MNGAFKLGTIKGIGIFIHWTFSLLILYIIYINYKDGQTLSTTLWTILFVLSIFVTVILHELGHSFAAMRYNIKTKNITILPIGGVARLESMPEKPKEELVVAIAGPLVNIALALITALFVTFPEEDQLNESLIEGINATNFFLNFLIVNVVLAVFNLIPAFPMDGGRIFRALLSMKLNRIVATKIAARVGQFLALGFILLGFYSNPFLIVIGLFILIGAQSEAKFTQNKSILSGYKVKDVLMTEYKTIDENDTIKTAVEIILSSQYNNFLVLNEGKPTGTLSRDEIIKALSKKGESECIQEVMNRNLFFLDSEQALEIAYQGLQEQGLHLAPVMENQSFIGVLDKENILEFILFQEAKRS